MLATEAATSALVDAGKQLAIHSVADILEMDPDRSVTRLVLWSWVSAASEATVAWLQDGATIPVVDLTEWLAGSLAGMLRSAAHLDLGLDSDPAVAALDHPEGDRDQAGEPARGPKPRDPGSGATGQAADGLAGVGEGLLPIGAEHELLQGADRVVGVDVPAVGAACCSAASAPQGFLRCHHPAAKPRSIVTAAIHPNSPIRLCDPVSRQSPPAKSGAGPVGAGGDRNAGDRREVGPGHHAVVRVPAGAWRRFPAWS
jgi:hypothetical protein